MKKPTWQPDKISLTILVLLAVGAAIGFIMVLGPNVRAIGGVIIFVCFAGMSVTIIVGQKVFYTSLIRGMFPGLELTNDDDHLQRFAIQRLTEGQR